MNKEIKFRAWDKENFIMHFSNENEDGIVWEIQPKIKFLELRTIDSFPGGEYHEQTEQWVEPKQVLMQNTGLKDKNGKEIWEGDVVAILKWVGNPDVYEEAGIYTISWSDNFAGFKFYPRNNDIHDCFDPNEENQYTVIGNIYENPELINN